MVDTANILDRTAAESVILRMPAAGNFPTISFADQDVIIDWIFIQYACDAVVGNRIISFLAEDAAGNDLFFIRQLFSLIANETADMQFLQGIKSDIALIAGNSIVSFPPNFALLNTQTLRIGDVTGTSAGDTNNIHIGYRVTRRYG